MQVEGAIYFVTSKGSQDQLIFKDKADYLMYLELLAKYKKQHGFRLYSYALMPDRLHLLVETVGDSSISDVMHDLTSLYTKHFNSKYHRRGPLFESRFKSVLVEKAQYLLALSRYTHRLARSSQEAYSSFDVFVPSSGSSSELDMRAEVEEVRAFLGSKEDPTLYEKYVLADVPLSENEELDKKLHRGAILGSEAFTAQVKDRIAQISHEKEEAAKESKRPARWVVVFVGAGVLVASAMSVYFYVDRRAMEAEYHKLLSEREGQFVEKSRFENRSPIAPTDLEGTAWTIELIPAGGNEVIKDTVRFEGGNFSSDYFSKQGFRPSVYFLVPKGAGLFELQTAQSNSLGDSVRWQGAWKADAMKGTVSVTPKGEKESVFSFYSTKWSYAHAAR